MTSFVSADIEFCAGKKAGAYSDLKDCSGYYECADNYTVKKYCSPGQLYNPLISRCDVAENVDCFRQSYQSSNYLRRRFNATKTANSNFKLQGPKQIFVGYRPGEAVAKNINYFQPFSVRYWGTKDNSHRKPLRFTELPYGTLTAYSKWLKRVNNKALQKLKAHLIFTGNAESETSFKGIKKRIQQTKSSSSPANQQLSQSNYSNTGLTEGGAFEQKNIQKFQAFINTRPTSKQLNNFKKNNDNLLNEAPIGKVYVTSRNSGRREYFPSTQYLGRKYFYFKLPYTMVTTGPKLIYSIFNNDMIPRQNVKLWRARGVNKNTKEGYQQEHDLAGRQEHIKQRETFFKHRRTSVKQEVSYDFPFSRPIFRNLHKSFEMADAEDNSPNQKTSHIQLYQASTIPTNKELPAGYQDNTVTHNESKLQKLLILDNYQKNIKTGIAKQRQMQQQQQKGKIRSNLHNVAAFESQSQKEYQDLYDDKLFVRPMTDQTLNGGDEYFNSLGEEGIYIDPYVEGLYMDGKTGEEENNKAEEGKNTLQEEGQKTTNRLREDKQWSQGQNNEYLHTEDITSKENSNNLLKNLTGTYNLTIKQNGNTEVIRHKYKQQQTSGFDEPEGSMDMNHKQALKPNSSKNPSLNYTYKSQSSIAGNKSDASNVTVPIFSKHLSTPSQFAVARPLVKPSVNTQKQPKVTEENHKKLLSFNPVSSAITSEWNETFHGNISDNPQLQVLQHDSKNNSNPTYLIHYRANGSADGPISNYLDEKTFYESKNTLYKSKGHTTHSMKEKVW